jgi:hypothetical protein
MLIELIASNFRFLPYKTASKKSILNKGEGGYSSYLFPHIRRSGEETDETQFTARVSVGALKHSSLSFSNHSVGGRFQ